jgi:diguanylate cyclase (GGDEF)-like protein
MAAMKWIYAHLLKVGLARGVAEVTLASMIASVPITWVCVLVFSPAAQLGDWLWTSMLAPAIVSPAVCYVILSLIHQLEATRRSLAQAAATDPLTGVGNRRRFFDIAARELALSRRQERAMSIIVLDLDDFKAINDRFGHTAGDAVLVEVARVCTEALRTSDLLCRWGGEEFVVLLPDTDEPGAHVVAERLRSAVVDASIAPPGTSERAPVTISLGIASTDANWNLDRMITEADAQLYRAKAAGRNLVMPPLAIEPDAAPGAVAATSAAA